jgi:capsid protein
MPECESYESFSERVLRRGAASVDVPFEALSVDFKAVEYSRAREFWLKVRERFGIEWIDPTRS